ncbi:MAG: site-specific DNA-methyltransferase [Candidatus Portnoybacteria bacterium]|nr:site-specific DNA-methyltransferase [Candidatus Portnoybacteria bacterium]MDD4983013.1 site-specific DNA-methyltransferase [Candidatus Portnoybacteria bacterium]
MKKSQTRKLKGSIKPETIWQLNEHRLAYGDCRDKELLKQLVGDEKINLICCDIPYAINAAASKRKFHALLKDKDIANDHLQSDDEYKTFNLEWLGAIIPFLITKNSAYLFNSDKMVWSLREAMIETGFKVAQLLIWIKSQAVIGRLDYAPQHELILYGWHGTHRFRRSKDKSVLFYPRPIKSKFHPTTKPIGLIRRLILNSSEIGDTVFDGFLGSGTALLACEQTRRKCFAVEIDLEYCLTAIKRWERLTGLTAQQL